MAAPGCGIIFAPSQRPDRSSSALRRTSSLNSKPRPAAAINRPTMPTILSADSGVTLTHSRTLSDKMRSLHRKKNSNETNTSWKMQPPVMAAPPSVKRNPKHMDLMEAVSQQDLGRQYNGGPKVVGIGKENVGQDGTMSRPAISKMEQDSRKIAYDQYLSQAFGLQEQNRPKPAAVQRLNPTQAPELRPESDISAKSTDSMEVLFHFSPTDLPSAPLAPLAPSAKDRRPKIQLMIPGSPTAATRPRSTAHLVSQMTRQKTKGRSRESRLQEPESGVSPPSSTTEQVNEAPARMSIVSPLSSVQMPRPRRPFSAWSLEEMTNDVPEMPQTVPALEKSNSSDSSDDAADQDDRSSDYSGRSSRSSLFDDPTREKINDRNPSIAFSILSPTAAGVFDGVPLNPQMPSSLRAFRSSPSLGVDTNKPLPPEPGISPVEPLNLGGYPRPDSTCRHNAPSPLKISRESSMDASYLPSRNASIRSKYTPADLDLLDAAFAKTSPNPNAQAAFYDHIESSLSQAQLDLEAHLGTISEEPLHHPNMAPAVNDPLQISRGPNTMVPTRQAPPPPSTLKLSDGSISGRNKLHKKSPVHVALQMRSDSTRHSNQSAAAHRRRAVVTAAPVRAASIVKANKILGKEGPTSVPMGREASAESSYSSSRSPDNDYSSSPTMSREDSSTPETDVSSVPETDHAFEEVRARLELLSPKKDPHRFVAYNSFNPHYGQTEPICAFRQKLKDDIDDTKLFDQPGDSNGEGRKDLIAPEIYVTPIKELTQPRMATAIDLGYAEDQSTVHPSLRPRTRPEELRPRSLASIAMSEIPDIYAALPSHGSGIDTARSSMVGEDIDRTISANAAETVLLRILQNLDNLQDLFATATVSRGFYRTFKRHELPLMKGALYGMSPAAWELREMSPPYPGLEGTSPTLDYTPSLYLQHYMRDMYTMIALKSMILIHCESFLRADTITALAGGETERASQIDDAFWRVWTFCQVFGCGSNREDDIVAQMDWLRGGPLAARQRQNCGPSEIDSAIDRNSVLFSSPKTFGRGNTGGLTAEELYDMTEIWTCLGVLVRGFQGKRQEAREFGIFQKVDIAIGDIDREDAVLEEWTYYLLTLAPPTVLDVASPTSPTAANFAHARSRGYTTWTPPSVSRATFLKEAVSRVYQEKISLRHSPCPSSPDPTLISPTIPIPSPCKPQSENDTLAARWRCARHAAEIRAKRNDPSFNLLPPSEDRPMSEFPAVLEALSTTSPTAPSMPPIPAVAPLHKRSASEVDTAESCVSALVVPVGPQVRDPVDLAVEKFVSMGFDKGKAAKALAETDTGNSIDFAAAMEWLVRERKRDVSGLMHQGYRGRIGGEKNGEDVAPEAVVRGPVGLGIPELRVVTNWD